MRIALILIAVVLSVGAAFDLLLALDVWLAESAARSVGEYLDTGAPVFVWALDVLRRALPETVLAPVLALPPEWFFPVRAALLTLCAAVLFAIVQARRA